MAQLNIIHQRLQLLKPLSQKRNTLEQGMKIEAAGFVIEILFRMFSFEIIIEI